MRILVTGASGNVGTALLRALPPAGHDVVSVTSRDPGTEPPFDGVERVLVDLGEPDAAARLTRAMSGVDAVVHLAWLLQPGHDRALLRRVNQGGTAAVVEAVRAAGVDHLVHMSSVGAYSPVSRPGAHETADESWPTGGVRSSSYSIDKSLVEGLVSALPDDRVTRVRPSLIVQPEAAHAIRNYFLGRFVPPALVRRSTLRLLPWPREVRFQLTHADDVAAGLRAVLEQRLTGPLNLAAEPVLDRARLMAAFGGGLPPLPLRLARAAATATWQARLQPTDAGWVDLTTQLPLLDATRARTELGWRPAHRGDDALVAFIDAMTGARRGPGPVLAG